mgnify:CR=1 FL=1
MGGVSSKIEADNLVEGIEKLRGYLDKAEQQALWLDSITILIKDKNKYIGLGNDGIETAVDKLYGKKPTKKIVILFHVHS